MPYRITINPARRFVFVRFNGSLTATDIERSRNDVVREPAFKTEFDLIIDFRNANLMSVGSAQLRSIAATSGLAAPARRAIVVGTPASFGVGRMFQIQRELAGGSEATHVFDNLADALRWLGLEDVDEASFND